MILRFAYRLISLTFLIPLVLAETTRPNSGDQQQGFTFSYPSSPDTNSVIIPLTPSCPSPLIISGLATTNNLRSSDPVAPYTMVFLVHEQLMDGAGQQYERMYSKSMDIGNMAAPRSIPNVWSNGTQFIGCVWANNGVSGGCQDLMTVSSSDLTSAAYANASSTCRTATVMGSWVTSPSSTLDVTVEHSAGFLASNGWPATCSDLRITPKNGTAPYNLLIAPAFHPPVNITSATQASMNYTIRLTHGQSFMLGVFDSAGNSFAFGPLHAGKADDVRCLAVMTGQETPAGVSGGVAIGVLAGGVVAAFFLGAAGAALILWGFVIKKQKRKGSQGRPLFDDAVSFRPYTSRNDLHQSYSNPKPLDPYEDSPHRGGIPFDSPDTLYDPYVGGSGTSNSPSKLPRPPGASFTVTSRQDFGPVLHRPSSRDDPNMAIHTPPAKSRHTNPHRNSIPSSSSGLTHHRRSSSEFEGKRPPPGLRLIGTPIASSSSNPWDDESDGEDLEGLYRSVNSRDVGKGGIRQRSSSGGIESQEDHEGSLRTRKVYVVHSDGGGGDVHIQLPEGGARVIEMPPDYRDGPVVDVSGGARQRSTSNLSPEAKHTSHFGPRAPRPSSATSQNSTIPRESANTLGDQQAPARSSVIRSKSGLERAEAAYLGLGLTGNPLSPPLRDIPGSPPSWDLKASESVLSFTGSAMSPEEIRARAEAAMAEKSARGRS